MFGLKFRNELTGAVGMEFDNLSANIRSYLLKGHTEDGGHSDVLATGDVTATGVGTFTGQPRAHVTPAANIALANGTSTQLTFKQPTFSATGDGGWDVGGLYNAEFPQFLTAPVAGNYLVSFSVRFAANGTGYRLIELASVGAGVIYDVAVAKEAGDGTNGNILSHTLILPMLVGQRVYLTATQNSGGSLNVLSGLSSTWFQLTKVG